jgi:hypothetical protein
VALAAVLAVALCASPGHARMAQDPPRFVPWKRIGDISLGAEKADVQREYGTTGHGYHVLQRYGNTIQGYYRLHHTRVIVTFYGRRVGELEFATPYYRTRAGFGVGSKIPLGPCHRTARKNCEHRWNGFVFNAWSRESPCNCWVKVGTGRRSLPATVSNFEKPWFFIYTEGGRATRFYFALKFVD